MNPAKKIFPFLLLVAGSPALTLIASEPPAPFLIASWTFEENYLGENVTGSSVGPISPDIGYGAATGFHADSLTSWSSPVGNGSAKSLNSNRWSAGDFYQFEVSTLGYSGLSLSWAMIRSSTSSPGEWELQYSIDGDEFLVAGESFTIPSGSWGSTSTHAGSLRSADLTQLTGLDNQESVFFRLVALSDGTNNGSTVRIDDFSVMAIPEPSAYAFGLGLLTLVAAVYRRRR